MSVNFRAVVLCFKASRIANDGNCFAFEQGM